MRQVISALALALAACSSQSSNDAADQQADTLDNAAEQSAGPAGDVLHNEADAIRDNGAAGSPGAPDSSVQNAMSKAGAAQRGDDARQAPVPGAPPLPKQAVPSGAEKATPPPTTSGK